MERICGRNKITLKERKKLMKPCGHNYTEVIKIPVLLILCIIIKSMKMVLIYMCI